MSTPATAPSEPVPNSAEPGPDEAPTPARFRHTLAWTAAVVFVTALVCNQILVFSVWANLEDASIKRLFIQDGVVTNLILISLVIVLLMALTARLWLTVGLAVSLSAVVAAANTNKLKLRGEPLYPSDLDFMLQPGFLLHMVPTSQLILAVVALVLLLLGAVLVGVRMSRRHPRIARRLEGRRLWIYRGIRVATVAVSILLLWSTVAFNGGFSPWRASYESMGVRWRYWDSKINYLSNGFPAGFLYNMPAAEMEVPNRYNPERVRRVAERYAARAERMNADRTDSLKDLTVITILSESLSDPTRLPGVELGEDPLQRTRATMAKTLSGTMLSPGYGGGTANVEFEVLTGVSMAALAPQLTTPYMQLLPHHPDYPTFVDAFGQSGHSLLAFHPYDTRMYRRPEVYRNMGFADLVDDQHMTVEPKYIDNNPYVADSSAFDQVLKFLDDNPDPMFLHVVTMQNHMPYKDLYTDPVEVRSAGAADPELLGQYARGVSYTDRALAKLLRQLKKLDRPVAVVLYGDHLPGQVYSADAATEYGDRLLHETPFLIWTNHGDLKPQDLPTVSPDQLMPLMFDAMGLKVTPYMALLDALREQMPAVERDLIVDAQNQDLTFDQMAELLPPKARRIWRDYLLLTYDLTIGNRWSAPAMGECRDGVVESETGPQCAPAP